MDYQETGLVDRIKGDMIRAVLADGMIPIFPNIGWSAGGRPYNISSDELTAALASEMLAEKLFYMTTRQGVPAGDYRLPEDIEPPREGYLSRLTADQARRLLDLNPGLPEDQPLHLVRLACRACQSGVPRVHVVDGRLDGVVLKEIFSSEGAGTMIYADEHAGVRPMKREDIPQVLRIMQPAVEKGILVPRTSELLEERLDDFVVFEVDGLVHACGALHRFSGGIGRDRGHRRRRELREPRHRAQGRPLPRCRRRARPASPAPLPSRRRPGTGSPRSALPSAPSRTCRPSAAGPTTAGAAPVCSSHPRRGAGG